jgi:hypothetical protein
MLAADRKFSLVYVGSSDADIAKAKAVGLLEERITEAAKVF